MKKTIIILIVIIILIIPFTVHGIVNSNKADKGDKVNDEIYDIYESLSLETIDLDSNDEFKDSIITICSKYNIKYEDIGNGNILVKLKATTGYEKEDSNTLECSYSKDDLKGSSKEIAIILATINNSDEHGALNILFTPKVNNKFESANLLDTKYLNTDNLINIITWNKKGIFQRSAETIKFYAEKDIKKVVPTDTIAYKISINGFPSIDSGDKTYTHANPIIYLSDFIRKADDDRTILQIASFSSDTECTNLPSDVTATVIIDKNSEAKFLAKLEKQQTKFIDKYRINYTDATFNFKKVNIPEKTLSLSDTSKLLSMLFTIDDGQFATSEPDNKGDTLVYNTIYSINTDQNIVIKGLGRSIDTEQTEKLIDTYNAAGELSEFNIAHEKRFIMWDGDADSDFIDYFHTTMKSAGISTEPRNTFIESECAIYKEKNPKMNIVSFGVSIENGESDANALIEYLAKKA